MNEQLGYGVDVLLRGADALRSIAADESLADLDGIERLVGPTTMRTMETVRRIVAKLG